MTWLRRMLDCVVLLGVLICASPLSAQSVQQSGVVTPTHFACWTTGGVIQDCGVAAQPFASTGGVSPGPFCVNSGPVNGPYQSFCLNANSSTGGILSIQNFGGAAAGGISLSINGSAAGIPAVVLPTISGDLAAFNNTAGTIIDSGISTSGPAIWLNDQFFGSGRPWCDVRALGAKGDGSTDDTAAFQACVTKVEAFSSSGTVYVPSTTGSYCLKTGPVVLHNANTRLIGESRNVQLNACNTDVTLVEMANSQQEISRLFLVGHGGGDGATNFSATKSVLLIDQACVDCNVSHMIIQGGLHNVEWHSGEARMWDVINTLAYGSSEIYIGNASATAGGWMQNIKPDTSDYPAGTPVSGTVYGNWASATLYTTGTVVSITCQDSNTYFFQATIGGTSGGSSPTCKNYGQAVIDNTVTWKLSFPNPFYHYQFDTGTSEVYLHDSDTGGGTAGLAMTNTLSGAVPTSIRLVNVNMGGGYQSNFWGQAGNDVRVVNAITNGCITSACGNFKFDSGFTGNVQVSNSNCGGSPYCATIAGGNQYAFDNIIANNSLTTGVANISGSANQVFFRGTFNGTSTFTNTSSGQNVVLINQNSWLLGASSFGLSGNVSAAAWTTNGIRYANVAGTLTDTSSSGTVATAYSSLFGGNTIAASSASTYTNYYGSYFKQETAGTNATLTNSWALGADNAHFGTSNTVLIGTGGNVTVSGGALTITSISGSTQCVQANSSGTLSGTGSNCGGAPANPNTSIQFNNSSVFGGSANLEWDGTGITIGASGTLGYAIFGNATSGTVKIQPVTGVLGTVTASLPANTGTIAELNLAQTWTAAQTFTNSDLLLLGSSTGATTFTSANAGASNFTLTVPANTGTIIENNIAQTFTAAQTETPTQAANTSVDGWISADTTVASSGNQQFSPRLRLTGQGWKTNSVAASQTVDWIVENQPVQGTANPTTNLVVSAQINGGGYSPLITVGSGAAATGSATFSMGTTNQQSTMVLNANANGTIPALGLSSGLTLIAADNANGGFNEVSYAAGGLNTFIRYDGSNASPSTLVSGDLIGSLSFGGYNGSAIASLKALVTCVAAETWSTTANGTYCETRTVPKTTTVLTAVFRVQPSGGASVGSANVATDGGNGILVATGATLTTLANSATTSAVCYNTGTGVLTYDGTIGTCNTSTRRVKHDIHPLQISALDAVMRMQPVSFYYNADQHTPGQQIGFVAEDLQKIDPRLVALDKDGQPFAIRFLGPMFSYVVGAIHQLKADNDNLRRELTALKRKIK